MTSLRKLGAAVLLMCVLGLTALADCPSPGQTDGPPCVSAAQPAPDDLTAPGQTDGPPAASESAPIELPSIAEIALNILTLF